MCSLLSFGHALENFLVCASQIFEIFSKFLIRAWWKVELGVLVRVGVSGVFSAALYVNFDGGSCQCYRNRESDLIG